jgi:hypothetical protein
MQTIENVSMSVNVGSKFNLRRFYGRRGLLFVVLLFAIVLVFSCFTSTFNGVSLFASGVPDKIVSNETELRDAIINAPTKKSFTIALNNDITLTETTLIIPANKDIILTSNKATGYYKLICTVYDERPRDPLDRYIVSTSTITVNSEGILELDGIDVTHADKSIGSAVTVNENGQFIMHSGLISNNSGRGVYNNGVFLMHDGKISGNTGGVSNIGVFRLFGGEISDNIAGVGGGVNNEEGGIFEMFGGEISGNTAVAGGGIYNRGGATMIGHNFIAGTKEIFEYKSGSFTLSSGIISCNTAQQGGGVDNQGVFIMNGGLISDNTATVNGGGVNNGDLPVISDFEMFGGEISGNTAVKGGGVYNYFNSKASLTGNGVISGNTAELGGGVCIDHDFNMRGGEISGNTASNNGGGVYLGNGIFKLLGGKISKNTAAYTGGGIWVDTEKLNLLFVSNGVVFSNNRASMAYDRDSVHDNVYRLQIDNKVTWTKPFVQGYNNYDISYTLGTPVVVAVDEVSGLDKEFFDVNGYVVFVVSIVVIVSVIIGGIFLYFKRKTGYN